MLDRGDRRQRDVSDPEDQMAPKIILIAGLPGSGKTTYMETLRQEGWSIYDDFKSNAHNDSSAFWHSRNYETLLDALRAGQKCVVADIDFCRTDSRNEAEFALRAQIPDLMINWLFFASDFGACHSNIRKRASASLEDDLRALNAYYVQYQIPADAQVIPVWKPSA